MRIHIVDPSAYTPPYDHALCRALGRAGAHVELYTSRFAYGQVAHPVAYRRHEFFYRAAFGAPGSRVRLATKLAQHVPDMLRYRRAALAAELVHFQWLSVQHVDAHLLPPKRTSNGRPRPLVLTAHDVLPREPRAGQLAAQRRLYERMDAVVVHSAHGRARLIDELGIDAARVHVIPHGVLRPWEGAAAALADGEGVVRVPRHDLSGALAGEPDASPVDHESLPIELRAFEGPVALSFGLMRPYKALDVLLDAWRAIDGAELWVVGMPRMDIAPLRAAAPANVRFLTRFVTDAEAHALLRRASLAVLPYREIDQSGVLFTALGAGVPLLLSDVGGFPEVAATGAARTVPADDPRALHDALKELLGNPTALAEMAARAHAAAQGAYSWDAIARTTLALYERLRAS
ncbi:MAG TPA: glycosyltransferase family 4 protein [Solirubrobacteraceae bacterium]|nr:glycosyltransferase family 4 protein [Solirubrobacteraceae bacterium]